MKKEGKATVLLTKEKFDKLAVEAVVLTVFNYKASVKCLSIKPA